MFTTLNVQIWSTHCCAHPILIDPSIQFHLRHVQIRWAGPGSRWERKRKNKRTREREKESRILNLMLFTMLRVHCEQHEITPYHWRQHLLLNVMLFKMLRVQTHSTAVHTPFSWTHLYSFALDMSKFQLRHVQIGWAGSRWEKKKEKGKTKETWSLREKETKGFECHARGWQTPIGCLKLQVTFRKRATNYGASLWEMTCKDKASCDSEPSSIQEATYTVLSHS